MILHILTDNFNLFYYLHMRLSYDYSQCQSIEMKSVNSLVFIVHKSQLLRVRRKQKKIFMRCGKLEKTQIEMIVHVGCSEVAILKIKRTYSKRYNCGFKLMATVRD